MKQNRHYQKDNNPWQQARGYKGGRSKSRFMKAWQRRSLLILFMFLLVIFVLASIFSYQPWLISWSQLILRQNVSTAADYQVHLLPDKVPGLELAPSDAVYLAELTDSLEASFTALLATDRPLSGQAEIRLETLIEVSDQERQQVLFQISEAALDETSFSFENSTSWPVDYRAVLELADYRTRATALAKQLDRPVSVKLIIIFSTDYTLQLPAGPLSSTATARLSLPLDQEVFTIEKETSPAAAFAPLWQKITYRVYLELFPWWVFLIAALLILLSLILLLSGTKSQVRENFWRRLKKMQHRLRGRLTLIGDKAWDPSWCVQVTDFKAMAKTARQLKQPVFCFVDEMSAWPAAYFYVQYGENNYCYIYTLYPEKLTDLPGSQLEEATFSHQMPVLPEAEELPLPEDSPEIQEPPRLIDPD